MNICLVRHGDAIPAEVDPERPLSEKGRAEVALTAERLKDQGARVEEIWHSSKLRAKQTAEIIAKVLNVAVVSEKPNLNPDDSVTQTANLLRKTNKTILIAGHLPFIPKLAALLNPSLGTIEVKTGGVVRVDV